MKVTEVVITDYFPPNKQFSSEWIDAARKLGFRAEPVNHRTLAGWNVVYADKAFYAVRTKRVTKGTKVWVTPIEKNEIDPARAGGVRVGSSPEASLKEWCKVMKKMRLEVQPLNTQPKGSDAFTVVRVAGNQYELYTENRFIYARLV